MVRLRSSARAKSEYEALRDARLLENQARLESLGVLNSISQLRQASAQRKKPRNKRVYGLTPLRRSQRITAATATATANHLPPPCSHPLRDSSTHPLSPKQEKVTSCEGEEEKRVFVTEKVTSCEGEEEKKRPANAPLVKLRDLELQISAESSAQHCQCIVLEEEKESIKMVRVRARAKSEYEALRNARMLENQARLESLGVLNSISQLRQASAQRKKPRNKRVYGLTPLRRSQRITATSTANHLPPPCSHPLRDSSTHPLSPKQEKVTLCEGEEEEKRPANAPLVKLRGVDLQISAESSALRCNSKGRGSIYNPVLGICCHFCRQKKLCGEEDCKRCGNFDVKEPCLGKTDCSVCHSSTGVFCRACLEVRYGEEIEEVRENKGWMCPHCIEEKGIKPYWICNSSICLRKRKIPPTGIAIYRAREMGYNSVAHLLMEELKRANLYKRYGIPM
ncbi:uncharacterized protein LOC133289771 [Gastrolobium bilobum]|uniref:uncharacterized protein LOC133289771 n=1 Tax=Gastrolobium bilobum TaxID=150636 RepID=UPI002AB1E28A|nr:uncharacterized protein LOC133289771 [Gastrolobium bilobum]